MGEDVGRGIDERAVRTGRQDLASGHILVRLNGIKQVSDGGIDAAVIGAERKGGGIIGRIAYPQTRGEAYILSRWQIDVKDVIVT